jgi:glycosyltransferase involved in cell wall biosynthesis
MKKYKKLLYLNYTPSPYRVDFFNEFSKFCDLTVLYYFDQFEDRTWSIKDKEHHYKWHILFPKNKYSISGFRNLVKFLTSRNFDIIIVGGYALPAEIFSIFVLKLLGKKFVLNTDGGFINTSCYKNFAKKILIRSASWWLSSGKNATQTLAYYGAKQDRIFEYHFSSVFANEIAQEKLSEAQKKLLRDSLNIPEYKVVIISIGQYISRKGFEYLMDAIQIINNHNIIVYAIGEGPLRNHYSEKIKRLNLNDSIFLNGQMSKDKILGYCKSADMFILPSLEDIWGLVINEAIACGLPVITTERVGAAYNLVKSGENGFIIPPKNSGILAEKINEILLDGKLNLFSKKSLEIAQAYTIEQMALDHAHIIDQISE